MADHLANQGRTTEPTDQSKRWTAPHQHQLTTAQAETCRKCGRLFFGARKCARHERNCPGTNYNEPELHYHPCRLCSQAFPTRKLRNAHQQTCQGDSEANLNCRYCNKSFETNKQRINHEGLCPDKQAHSRSPILWECPRCSWRILASHLQPSKLAEAQRRHNTHCKGSEEKPTVPVVSAVNNGRTCKQGWRTNPDASVMNRHAHADVAEESSTPKLDEWDMKNAADRPVSFEFIRPDTPGQTDFPTLIPFPLPPPQKKITLLD